MILGCQEQLPVRIAFLAEFHNVVTALIALLGLKSLQKKSGIELTIKQEIPTMNKFSEIYAALLMTKLGSLTCLILFVPFSKWIRSFNAKLRVALTPSPDYWTWITRDGVGYEDVEVLFVRAKRVTFRHKMGTACVPISMLSETDRKHLANGYQADDSLTMLPDAEPAQAASVHSKAA
jgi:hypothetical protein